MDEEKEYDPSHYKHGKFEVWEIIDDAGLGYNLSCALKYILRCFYKEDTIEDIKKAIDYLQHFVDNHESLKDIPPIRRRNSDENFPRQ